MVSIRVKRFLGLQRPYDFAVASRFLIASSLLVLTVAGVLALWLIGRISANSNRFYFAIELVALFSAAILLVREQVLSTIIICVGALEIALALVTPIGFRLGYLTYTLLPSNSTCQKRPFRYHPLLVGVPIENYTSSCGLDVRHNSKGLRGSEIASITGKTFVAVFGGSSTYDLGVPNGSTWPENLEKYLGNAYIVANFGVPGYGSAEHIIQTAFLADVFGPMPACALYYVGWNDIRNAHVPGLDGAYANFHFLSQFDNLQIRRSQYFSPIYTALKPSDLVPRAPELLRMPALPGSDPILERIFTRNISTLIAINRARGTKTVLVGQLLNREKLTRNRWTPLLNREEVWPVQARFNQLLEEQASNADTLYIDPHIEMFSDKDFVDEGHFSNSGSTKFAKQIESKVRNFCK